MQRGDQTRASKPSQPLLAMMRHLTRPIHGFCRRRSSLTLSISFVGVVLLAKMGLGLRGAVVHAAQAIQDRSLLGDAGYYAEYLGAWERVTAVIAETAIFLRLVAAPILALMIILKPRHAGVWLLSLVALGAVGGAGVELQFVMGEAGLSRWAGTTPWLGDSAALYMLENTRWLLSAVAFPALLGLWYVAVARRHLRSSIEFQGRRWDAAPQVWRSLVIVVLAAMLIQHWETCFDPLRHFVTCIFVGGSPEFVAAFTKPEHWNNAAILLMLALGLVVCATRRRAVRSTLLVMTVLAVISRILYFAYLDRPYTAWAFTHQYIPILLALTTLFCYAQENDWTEERHVVCGSCGYFMGGAEGANCPECGAERPGMKTL